MLNMISFMVAELISRNGANHVGKWNILMRIIIHCVGFSDKFKQSWILNPIYYMCYPIFSPNRNINIFFKLIVYEVL